MMKESGRASSDEALGGLLVIGVAGLATEAMGAAAGGHDGEMLALFGVCAVVAGALAYLALLAMRLGRKYGLGG